MKRLEDLKVEGLLAQRDIVLATSIEHMAGVDDCKMNLDQIKLSVIDIEPKSCASRESSSSLDEVPSSPPVAISGWSEL